jgi:hypothetical protein
MTVKMLAIYTKYGMPARAAHTYIPGSSRGAQGREAGRPDRAGRQSVVHEVGTCIRMPALAVIEEARQAPVFVKGGSAAAYENVERREEGSETVKSSTSSK